MKQLIHLSLLVAAIFFHESVAIAQQILEPGVSYVARQYVENGDAYGIHGPEYHSVEITAYKDGSASAIYSIGMHDYDEDGCIKVNLTGNWKTISKYDRKVIDIFLKCEGNSYFKFFHIYVDSNQKAYLRDLNNSPAQLYKKSDLKPVTVKTEEQIRREEKAEIAKMLEEVDAQYEIYKQERAVIEKEFASLMRQSKVLYEIVDLGLSVKWGNVNLNDAFCDDDAWDKLWSVGPIHHAQLDYIGSLYHTSRTYDNLDRNRIEYEYERTKNGVVKIRPYNDLDGEYVGGGSWHGSPVPFYEEDNVKKALLLSLEYNPDPSLNTPGERAQWAGSCAKSSRYPTKAEWQELMDNCTVSGVEINPSRLHPISRAYYKNSHDDLNVKMLRLTSKVNGNSIVLPFDSIKGTNYATSQYLSSNPNEVTCVHVDENGLSFLEVNRSEKIAHRIVFGGISPKIKPSLEADIQAARANYPNSPYALEQKQLKEDFEQKLMDGMLTIGAPSITVKDTLINSTNDNYCFLEIKAPIISGKITKNSRVLVAVDFDINTGEYYRRFNKAKIREASGSTPAYIVTTYMCRTHLPKTDQWIKRHSVYFISDNFLNNYRDKEIENEGDLDQFLRTFSNESIYSVMRNGYNNAYNQKTNRRIAVTPATYFSLQAYSNIKYESGPSPIPSVGTPEVLNLGTTKGKGTYSNVEIGFDITESDYPLDHPITQSFDLQIKTNEKVIKTKYVETVGNKRKYIIKKMSVGIPYTLTGYAIDQYGVVYDSSVIITINSDGTVTAESIRK